MSTLTEDENNVLHFPDRSLIQLINGIDEQAVREKLARARKQL